MVLSRVIQHILGWGQETWILFLVVTDPMNVLSLHIFTSVTHLTHL